MKNSFFRPFKARPIIMLHVEIIGAVLFSLGLANASDLQPAKGPSPTLMAPPISPPVIQRRPLAAGLALPQSAAAVYSIGDPTDEEQLYLEALNFSRAHPQTEAHLLATTTDPQVLPAYAAFQVDLNLMLSQYVSIAPAPPLAMNSKLLAAARLHSADMLSNVFQGHSGSDGSTIGTRINDQGYDFRLASENVYSYSDSVFFGTAAFEVDWGGSTNTGGMQSPPGHRNNIHNAAMREIGIGVIDGSNSLTNDPGVPPVGPQVVTEDFATAATDPHFITGVAYYDFNHNGVYDAGEGIGGITVAVNGLSLPAVTANSGGYAVPVPGSGAYQVTFSASGLLQQLTAVVNDDKNVKLDYVAPYAPPALSGPGIVRVGHPIQFDFSTVGAAIGYQMEASLRQNYTVVEGAENGLSNVTVQASTNYSVIARDISNSGAASFHLAHPAPPSSQFITLNPAIVPAASSQLVFYKRLGWATPDESAQVQISADDGVTWTTVWSQAGTGSAGDANFRQQSVSLATFAGETIHIRFAYVFGSGSFFPQTDLGVGFYLDDISLTSAQRVLNVTTTDLPPISNFQFVPSDTGSYGLRVRGLLPGRALAYGPPAVLTVMSATAPFVQITGLTNGPGGVQIKFSLDGVTIPTFKLYTANQPNGPWSLDSNAALQALNPSSSFQFSTASGGAKQRFYQVRTQ